MGSTVTPIMWTPCTRVVVIVNAQCVTSSVSSSLTISLLNNLLSVPGSLAMCSFASVSTGKLCGSKLGVGGGDSVIHSKDHPPHGSGGAFSPLIRVLIILATIMRLEKKKINADTDMNMFHPAASMGSAPIASSVVTK